MNGMKTRCGPSGIQFFDRLTGLNILVDEVRVPIPAWSKAPRHVSIALTNACELKCAYCFAPKTAAKLSASDVSSWLTELDNNGCLGVGFGGGEPTLHPAFVSICGYASTHTGLAVCMTTHGHQFTPELVCKLRHHVNFIRLSMDGVQHTYERLRGRRFAEFLSKAAMVAEVSRFGINYVVNAETLRCIDEAAEIAQRLGACEMLLLPQLPNESEAGIPKTQLENLADWVREYRGGLRLTISEQFSEIFPACDPLTQENGTRAFVHVNASGLLLKNSFERQGIPITRKGIMNALQTLEMAE